jgi:hypothetical protein
VACRPSICWGACTRLVGVRNRENAARNRAGRPKGRPQRGNNRI